MSERELTAREREALEAEGVTVREVNTDPIAAGLGEQARMLSEALDVQDAAQKIGITAAGVVRMLGERRLYGIKEGRAWRLPRWQFRERGKGTVPGVEEVIEAMPRGLHPLSVQGFMTTPQPELRLRGAAVPPLVWLASGGDPVPVVNLAAEL